MKPDPRLRWEVVAEGLIPREAYVDEPQSPSLRKRAGLAYSASLAEARESLKATLKPPVPLNADSAGDGGEGAEGEGQLEIPPEPPTIYSIQLKLKEDFLGDLLFTCVLEDAEKDPEAAPAEEGEEAPPAAEKAEEGEGEGENLVQDEFNAENSVVQAGLPIDELDADALIDCVRFPFLEHQELVDASRDPVLHEIGYQHLVVEALSTRLAAYEPGTYQGLDKDYEVGPRTALLTKAASMGGKTPKGAKTPKADGKKGFVAEKPVEQVLNF